VRKLRSDLVELERGEKADDTLGYPAAYFGERTMTGRLRAGEGVKTARDALELAALVQLDEHLRRPPVLSYVGGADERLPPREIEDSF
jgi:hypothetical protein